MIRVRIRKLYFILENAPIKIYLINLKFKRLPADAARYYLACALSCCKYLHSKQYVHRDIKPENFMLTGDLKPKLGDFGCVRILKDIEYPGAWFTGP
eukprot:UN03109